MKKVYTKQKENACFNETIVANNDLINAITNTSFRSWYYDATNWYFYKIKFENEKHHLKFSPKDNFPLKKIML
jgi:hypothetical protein